MEKNCTVFVDINLVDYNNGTFGASYLLSFSGEYILGVYYLHDSVGDSGSIIESDARTRAFFCVGS